MSARTVSQANPCATGADLGALLPHEVARPALAQQRHRER